MCLQNFKICATSINILRITTLHIIRVYMFVNVIKFADHDRARLSYYGLYRRCITPCGKKQLSDCVCVNVGTFIAAGDATVF